MLDEAKDASVGSSDKTKKGKNTGGRSKDFTSDELLLLSKAFMKVSQNAKQAMDKRLTSSGMTLC